MQQRTSDIKKDISSKLLRDPEIQGLLNDESAFEGGSNSIEDITKPRPKLKVGIVGYGPAGVITAIGLTKQGHEVTMFERLFYNYKDKADKSN